MKNNSIIIKLAEKGDLENLAVIYAEAFNEVDAGETWDREGAYKLLEYFYIRQADLFFVAQDSNEVIGGIASLVKPWWNGMNLVEGELFVKPNYHGRGIAKQLLKKHLEVAIKKYHIQSIRGLANGRADFPMSWYKKLGFKTTEWVDIEGEAKVILENLE